MTAVSLPLCLNRLLTGSFDRCSSFLRELTTLRVFGKRFTTVHQALDECHSSLFALCGLCLLSAILYAVSLTLASSLFTLPLGFALLTLARFLCALLA